MEKIEQFNKQKKEIIEKINFFLIQSEKTRTEWMRKIDEKLDKAGITNSSILSRTSIFTSDNYLNFVGQWFCEKTNKVKDFIGMEETSWLFGSKRVIISILSEKYKAEKLYAPERLFSWTENEIKEYIETYYVKYVRKKLKEEISERQGEIRKIEKIINITDEIITEFLPSNKLDQKKIDEILIKKPIPRSVNIINHTDEIQKVSVFDTNKLDEVNYGNPVGIEFETVDEELSYREIACEFKNDPPKIGLIRLLCDNRMQLFQNIDIHSESETPITLKVGEYVYSPYGEIVIEDPSSISDIVEIPYEYTHNESTRIEVELLPHTTLKLRLYSSLENKEEELTVSNEYTVPHLSGIPLSDRSQIHLKIKNNSKDKKQARLFGYSNNHLKPNFGTDNEVEVSSLIGFIDYPFLLSESALNPFDIEHIRLASKNKNQLVKLFRVEEIHSTSKSSSLIYTESHYDKKQVQKNINDIKLPRPIKINSKTELLFFMEPETELSVICYLKNRKTAN